MTLAERLAQDLTDALKQHAAERVSVLRFLKSSLQNAQIAKREALTDTEVEKCIAAEVKRRHEAAEQFRAGGRTDLATADESAAELLQVYLPQPLTDEALATLVREQVAAVGAASPADFGKVMGPLMAAVGTRADGKRVQAMVKQVLSA